MHINNVNNSTVPKSRGSLVGHLVRRGMPLLILTGVLVGGYELSKRVDLSPKKAASAPPPGPIPVSILTARSETVPVRVQFLGQTEASQVVEIRARIPGHIVARTFEEGAMVQEGSKLFQIDPRPFEVELLQAKARLASAEAELSRASSNLSRNADLAKNQAATQSALERAQADQQVAAAAVEVQKAGIAAAELQLKYTTIEAPVSGRIGQVNKDVGNYIDAGSSAPLATVRKVDPIYVRFPITETETLRFRRQVADGSLVSPDVMDLELEVTLADGAIYPHRGKINFQDVQFDQLTGTMVVRGSVPNAEGELAPGQFIHTTIIGPKRINVIRVPQSAVMQSPLGASVYVVGKDSQAESRRVTLGDWSGKDQWIIEHGLKEGDQVVLDRLMVLRPGMPVMASIQ